MDGQAKKKMDLTQFGPTEVIHHFALRTLQLPSAEQATTVMVGRANKQYISKGEWKALTNCVDIKTVNALVEEYGLAAIAAFHMQVDDTKFFIKLRVRTDEVRRWLQAPLPLSLAPVGEEGLKYRMIWERDAQTYEELRSRCADIPGYAGIAEGKDGLGIRIVAPQLGPAWGSTFFPGKTTRGPVSNSGNPLRGRLFPVWKTFCRNLVGQPPWCPGIGGCFGGRRRFACERANHYPLKRCVRTLALFERRCKFKSMSAS